MGQSLKKRQLQGGSLRNRHRTQDAAYFFQRTGALGFGREIRLDRDNHIIDICL
jgi:hypothetical protein